MDVWIGNAANSPRAIRFYGPNASLTYAGATHVDISASNVATATYRIYLPIAAPAIGQKLQCTSIPSAGNYQMSWI